MNKHNFICFLVCFLLSLFYANGIVNAGDVSFEDFKTELENRNQSWELVEQCSKSSVVDAFIKKFNNSSSFIVVSDFGWTTNTPDNQGPHYYYIFFNTVYNLYCDKAQWVLYSTYNNDVYYRLNLNTNVLEMRSSTNGQQYGIINWSIVSYPQFSTTTFNTLDCAYYFLSHAVLFGKDFSIIASTSTGVRNTYSFSDFKDSPFPWDKGEIRRK